MHKTKQVRWRAPAHAYGLSRAGLHVRASVWVRQNVPLEKIANHSQVPELAGLKMTPAINLVNADQSGYLAGVQPVRL